MKKITLLALSLLSLSTNLFASENKHEKIKEGSEEQKSSPRELESDKKAFNELVKGGKVNDGPVVRDTDCDSGTNNHGGNGGRR